MGTGKIDEIKVNAGGTKLYEILGGNGGNWALFSKHQDAIGAFIKAGKLREAKIGHISAGPTLRVVDLGINGGIKTPHLHYQDKIFLLNEHQWAEFSAKILADCRAKLANVKEISFEEGMLLGSVVETVGES